MYDRNLSQRAKHLRQLESYVQGTQYEGMPDWFSDKKPLWERAPCIVIPIVRNAIDSNTDLLLGEGRFPSFRVGGLADEAATDFEAAIVAVVKQARFKAAAREVFSAGQSTGSACAIFGVRSGRLFIDTLTSWWCQPELATDGTVLSLEVKYPYLKLIRQADGTETYVCKLYRRIIDAQSDTTFLPGDCREDGIEPKWVPDPKQTYAHGLGFCPVVWFPHLKGCSAVDDFDGKAIHEHLTDEIRAYDFAVSQRHRAALYAGDPQWTEIGVEPGYNPTGNARKAEVPGSLYGRPGDAARGGYISESPNAGKVRKKSPGTIWQYPGKNPEVKVELHTLPGDALQALDAHAKDLRAKLAEALGVVFIDPESLPNESRISGKALESFKSRQLDKVNHYRADFGDRFILPAIGMLLRVAIQTNLTIPALPVVRRVAEADPSWSWHCPNIDLIWGAYFQPSGQEEEMLIRATSEALAAGITTRRAAVEKLQKVLGVNDVDVFMTELDKERKELAQQTVPEPPIQTTKTQ